MEIKVSVIIPVYNAERFLTECIDSLLGQTLKECEFIFVNDGSKDNSREIIEQYLNRDKRIILVNQENQGVSIARNTGLKKAAGEYVGFVDADDYVAQDFYEKLYYSAKLDKCDIVISNFESEIEGNKVITGYPFPVNIRVDKNYIKHHMLPYFIENDDLNSACNKIYKNKLLRENNIEFPAKVALGEDGVFNLFAFSYADAIKYIDYTGYHYNEIIGSATRNLMEMDYFKRALEVYHFKIPDSIAFHLDQDKVQIQKASKLIKSVMSYIHIYFNPTPGLSYRSSYNYIRSMITNNSVKEALRIYVSECQNTLGRYDKVLISLIYKQSVLGLFLITAYSRYRNKNNLGEVK